jgi:tripartite-type tricarboxylate transporter receptor subunit TctC
MALTPKLAVVLTLSLLFAGQALANDYPNRPIRAIASQAPGGLSDIFMRALGKELSTALGQPVTIENRVGANGTIGTKACADAEPDGYTFCILNDEPILVNPLTLPGSDFDPPSKLIPITRLFNVQQVFAVAGAASVKSFDDLIAEAKKNPRTMNYMAPSILMVAFMEELNKKYGFYPHSLPRRGGMP